MAFLKSIIYTPVNEQDREKFIQHLENIDFADLDIIASTGINLLETYVVELSGAKCIANIDPCESDVPYNYHCGSNLTLACALSALKEPINESIEVSVPLIGFEGLYEVSNLGNIYSLDWNRTAKRKKLKPYSVERYSTVVLYKEGKRYAKKVHRAVAEAFLPNPENLPQVNHKDENKNNNIITNLEWCDQAYNNNYGSRTQRTSKVVISFWKYNNEFAGIYNSCREAGRITGIDNSSINDVCNGKLKYAGSRTWKYIHVEEIIEHFKTK